VVWAVLVRGCKVGGGFMRRLLVVRQEICSVKLGVLFNQRCVLPVLLNNPICLELLEGDVSPTGRT
jgi:hypothetical protein